MTVGYTNLYLEPGPWAPEEIVRSVERGLYVTELIGFGVNFVTGDYSRGAVGFWIENGELTYPVEEITIAGNLRSMLQDVEMVGRDLDLSGSDGLADAEDLATHGRRPVAARPPQRSSGDSASIPSGIPGKPSPELRMRRLPFRYWAGRPGAR